MNDLNEAIVEVDDSEAEDIDDDEACGIVLNFGEKWKVRFRNFLF